MLKNQYFNENCNAVKAINQIGNLLYVRSNLHEEFLSWNEVRVTNTDIVLDSHISPGGRGDKGDFSLNMRPGGRYIAMVEVVIDEPLPLPLAKGHLEIEVDIRTSTEIVWGWKKSQHAPNVSGVWNLYVQFDVPIDAKGCWIRLQMGANQNASVVWKNFMLVDLSDPLIMISEEKMDT